MFEKWPAAAATTTTALVCRASPHRTQRLDQITAFSTADTHKHKPGNIIATSGSISDDKINTNKMLMRAINPPTSPPPLRWTFQRVGF